MERNLLWLVILYLPLACGESQFQEDAAKIASNLSSTLVYLSQLDNSLTLPREARKDSKMEKSERLEVIRLHNLYRSMVVPPAADMEYMEWDDRLASYSQQWAEKCKWNHGFPPQNEFPSEMGQNLYRGSISSVAVAIRLWYEEYVDYHYHNTSCNPKKECGHYTQMVWSTTVLVGCGIRARCWRNYGYYIVCNYWPSHYGGVKPYKIGRPCSLCNSTMSGLCFSKSCVSRSQCEKYKLDCGCDLICHNCGTRNDERCTCSCKDGWTGVDCSEPCADKREDCSFYHCVHYTSANNHPCEKYCNLCKPVNPKDLSKGNTCCDGVTCPPGQVLDLSDRPCECKPLCPGPKCGALVHKPHFILLVVAIVLSEYHV